MARTPQPFKPGEWVLYPAPGSGYVRVQIRAVYSTRTGERVVVVNKEGRQLRVRPSQLRRR